MNLLEFYQDKWKSLGISFIFIYISNILPLPSTNIPFLLSPSYLTQTQTSEKVLLIILPSSKTPILPIFPHQHPSSTTMTPPSHPAHHIGPAFPSHDMSWLQSDYDYGPPKPKPKPKPKPHSRTPLHHPPPLKKPPPPAQKEPVKGKILYTKINQRGKWGKMKEDICYYTRFALIASGVWGVYWVWRIWTRDSSPRTLGWEMID